MPDAHRERGGATRGGVRARLSACNVMAEPAIVEHRAYRQHRHLRSRRSTADVADLRVHPRHTAGIPEVQLAPSCRDPRATLTASPDTGGDYGSYSSLKPLPCRHF
jgi:hypothetical protein